MMRGMHLKHAAEVSVWPFCALPATPLFPPLLVDKQTSNVRDSSSPIHMQTT
jgi:hypothetical protein